MQLGSHGHQALGLPYKDGWADRGAVLQPFLCLCLEGSSVCLYLGYVAYMLLADLAGEGPEPGGTWY